MRVSIVQQVLLEKQKNVCFSVYTYAHISQHLMFVALNSKTINLENVINISPGSLHSNMSITMPRTHHSTSDLQLA